MTELAIPQNPDAEAAVLGSCLLDRDAIGQVVDWLAPTDFYTEAHATIYAAMAALYRGGTPIDYLTVSDALERGGGLERVGGPTALTALLGTVPTPVHIERYGRIVADHAQARRLISAGGSIAALGYRTPDEPEQLFVEAERLLEAARGTGGVADVRTFLSILQDYLDELTALHAPDAGLRRIGLPSGWVDFDRLTQGGLQRGNLAVLAGRPGLGKTAVVLALATHAALHLRVPVLLFSIEMTRSEIAARIVGAESRISPGHTRSGPLTKAEQLDLGEAFGKLSDLPLWVDDSATQSLGSIKARARRLAHQVDLGLVVVDHLQLVSGGRTFESRNQELAEISRGLKALARELSAPVLVVSQLNRAVESRTNKRPQLSDLRDSGAVEQDADLVVLLYRDDYYNPETEALNVAELHVAKQRNGPTGLVELFFDRPLGRFLDLAIGYGRTIAPVGGLVDD